jgi:hypothetical protein
VGYEKETAKQQIWTQWLQEKYIPVGNWTRAHQASHSLYYCYNPDAYLQNLQLPGVIVTTPRLDYTDNCHKAIIEKKRDGEPSKDIFTNIIVSVLFGMLIFLGFP